MEKIIYFISKLRSAILVSGLFFFFMFLFDYSYSFSYSPASGEKESLFANLSDVKDYSKFSNKEKYLGVYMNDPQSFLNLKERPKILAWFEKINKEPLPSAKLFSACNENDFIPLITIEPLNIPLKDIAEGKYDDLILKYFSQFSICDNSDVLVRFAHEMEMRPSYGYKNWYSWQSYDSATYVSAWKHTFSLIRGKFPNIKWIWSPNRADYYSLSYYPGDEFVDYVSLTLNNTNIQLYPSFSEYYNIIGRKDYLEKFNKPIIISECAFHGYEEKLKSNYLKSIIDYLFSDDKIVAIVLFDEDVDFNRMYKFTNQANLLSIFYDGVRKTKEFYHEQKI